MKEKTDFASFIESANRICPLSKDKFPEKYIENIYNSVSHNPFFTPISRSLLEESFNQYTLNEIAIRLAMANKNRDKELTESEFINAADLT